MSAVVAPDAFDFTLPEKPYPGLRPFEKDEWPIFFGRERMVDEIIERLIRHRFIVVHGDSGCGKSSLIRAGVLPHLEQECARGGAAWRTSITAPGDAPLANFAAAAAALTGNGNADARQLDILRTLNFGKDGTALLAARICDDQTTHVCILIDQFEELFQHARRQGPHQANLLIEQLVALHNYAGMRPYIVLTMRSEFLGACAQYEGFAEIVNATQYLVPRMERGDLMRSIREPALLYDGEVTFDLAARLIDDAGGTQDQLPLIQHGLMMLHRAAAAREGPWRLTVEGYGTPGKLGQLLSDHADEVMCAVEPDNTSTRGTEDVFRALTDINADGRAIRFPRKLHEIVAISGANEETIKSIINAFRAEGVSLLRPYGAQELGENDLIDISHEALIRCWQHIAEPRDGWLIREFRNGLVWRSLLVQTDSFERDPSNVLSAATTEERQVWLQRRNAAWCERYGGGWSRVLKMVEASVAERERHLRDENQRRAREEDAKLREQQLQADLAIAEEKSRRAKTLRRATSVLLALVLVVAFAAVSAYRSRAVALKKVTEAEQSQQALDIAIKEAESRRGVAEESLKKISAELTSVNNLTNRKFKKKFDEKASEAENSLATIQAAATSIAQQVAVLNDAAKPSPRIYIHISDESQRTPTRELELRIEAAGLEGNSVIVPGIQLFPTRAQRSFLRCFVATDCTRYGAKLVALINAQLSAPNVELQDFSSTYTPPSDPAKALKPQHFELYFAAGLITLIPTTNAADKKAALGY